MVLSREVLDEICLRTFEGESMRSICRDPTMPSRQRLYRELVDNSDFAAQYARAREGLYQSWAEEILEIADDGTTDFVTKVGRNGHEYEAVDQEHIQRSRLRVDSRKWLLSKLLPKTFGDKVQHDHEGEVAVHHDISSMSEREKMRRFALFMLEDQQANGPVTMPGNVTQSHHASQPAGDEKPLQAPMDKSEDADTQPAG
jgi:hypothetical protein